MKKKNKAKWIKALRSGKFEQTRELLFRAHDSNYKGDLIFPRGFCCLGVYFKVVKGLQEHGGAPCFVGLESYGTTLFNEGLPDNQRIILEQMNDSGSTFLEIADWIEINVKED